jgi:hypothetical protein
MWTPSASSLLSRAPNGTEWVALVGGKHGWKCILPERETAPGKGHGRTPLEALAAALEGR